MKRPLIILTGPTAVGKTELSLSLAKAVNGEIISADSIQIYKYMDIGSAKILPQEMDGVRHYLIDELLPDEEFHVVRFQQMAKECIEDIYRRGKVPVLVGGTGFYIQAVLYDIDFSDSVSDGTLRKKYEDLAQQYGNAYVHELLRQVDEASAQVIHANNIKRVIRALEYYEQTGEKISEHNECQHQKESPYQFCYFVLNRDRESLYSRIDQRVDAMMDQGLLSEVEKLKKMGYGSHLVSMQGLGYKEIYAYLEGRISLEEAVYRIKRDTRHFAKRQLTWFRRERNVTWVNYEDFHGDTIKMLSFMIETFQNISKISKISKAGEKG